MCSGIVSLLSEGNNMYRIWWIALFVTVMLVAADKMLGAEPEIKPTMPVCGSDTDCATQYDYIHGKGAASELEMKLRECGSPSPLADCPIEYWPIADPAGTEQLHHNHWE
jgi:hypothetical protein